MALYAGYGGRSEVVGNNECAFTVDGDLLGHSRDQQAFALTELDGVVAVVGDGEIAFDASISLEFVDVLEECLGTVDLDTENGEVRAAYEFGYAVDIVSGLGDVGGIDSVVDGIFGFFNVELTGRLPAPMLWIRPAGRKNTSPGFDLWWATTSISVLSATLAAYSSGVMLFDRPAQITASGSVSTMYHISVFPSE